MPWASFIDLRLILHMQMLENTIQMKRPNSKTLQRAGKKREKTRVKRGTAAPFGASGTTESRYPREPGRISLQTFRRSLESHHFWIRRPKFARKETALPGKDVPYQLGGSPGYIQGPIEMATEKWNENLNNVKMNTS